MVKGKNALQFHALSKDATDITNLNKHTKRNTRTDESPKKRRRVEEEHSAAPAAQPTAGDKQPTTEEKTAAGDKQPTKEEANKSKREEMAKAAAAKKEELVKKQEAEEKKRLRAEDPQLRSKVFLANAGKVISDLQIALSEMTARNVSAFIPDRFLKEYIGKATSHFNSLSLSATRWESKSCKDPKTFAKQMPKDELERCEEPNLGRTNSTST